MLHWVESPRRSAPGPGTRVHVHVQVHALVAPKCVPKGSILLSSLLNPTVILTMPGAYLVHVLVVPEGTEYAVQAAARLVDTRRARALRMARVGAALA